jgi:hypothetical protein
MSRFLNRLLAAYTPLAARHLLIDGMPHAAPDAKSTPCEAEPEAASASIEIPCVRVPRAHGSCEQPDSLAA